MLDSLFRRGNPTNAWTREPGLRLTVDLAMPSINSIPVGSIVDKFSFLGRSNSKSKSPLDYIDLGISLDYEEDGTVSGFQVVLADPLNQFEAFSGTIKINESAVDSGTLIEELGDCYWLDRDENELIYFYEFPTHEIQIEQLPMGSVQRIIVTNDPLMADVEQRKSYGVDKPWPPN